MLDGRAGITASPVEPGMVCLVILVGVPRVCNLANQGESQSSIPTADSTGVTSSPPSTGQMSVRQSAAFCVCAVPGFPPFSEPHRGFLPPQTPSPSSLSSVRKVVPRGPLPFEPREALIWQTCLIPSQPPI
ncbi:hypothetical protein PAPYR_1572 [Paratrimastix pyriformis]|uniref:Uncharacterized protein n=1 Tax=Paratrimastix pyriformis TaxID=342808 RepID=A0ABQ8UWD8_9EUKA|nr:hypothetical protein PAPYR_1572 [Paratrimastix pyriformis]